MITFESLQKHMDTIKKSQAKIKEIRVTPSYYALLRQATEPQQQVCFQKEDLDIFTGYPIIIDNTLDVDFKIIEREKDAK